jgi:uncharacterized protein YbaP (TraB family)
MSYSSLIRVLVFSILAGPVSSWAGVYKCLDQKRKVVYQDKPCQELTSVKLSPALSLLAPEDSSLHFLWKVKGEKGSAFLLGSLSYGAKEVFPLPEAIMDVFAETNVLVIMSDLQSNGYAELQPSVTTGGSYSDGSSLGDHIEEATLGKVLELAKKLDIAEDLIANQKPWLASLTLRKRAVEQSGYGEAFDMGRTFVAAAGTLKPIVKMDFTEEQIKLYEKATELEQEQILLAAINEIDNKEGRLKSLVGAWKKGDAEGMKFIARQEAGDLPAAQKLTESFSAWQIDTILKNIEEWMADGRTYFIVLDAHYLVGEGSLLERLESEGLQVLQL